MIEIALILQRAIRNKWQDLVLAPINGLTHSKIRPIICRCWSIGLGAPRVWGDSRSCRMVG